MTSRRLLILGALALVAIVAAFLLVNHRSATPTSALPGALFPDLKGQLDSVDAVRLYKAGDARAVEVVRTKDGWAVGDREGYSADAVKVRKLLLALAEAKPLEEKTSNAEQYAKLGVEDVTQPAASGIRIELHGQKTPVNLIAGKPGNGAQAMYVRRTGEPASWLINQTLETPSTPDAWLRKEIIEVPADRIQSAAITVGIDKGYTAAKQARTDTDFKVDAIPKGRELSSPSAANGVASALTSVTLVDVKSAKNFGAAKPAAHATFKAFDGLVIDADGWNKDGKHYLALKTAFDEAQARQFHIEVKAPEKPANSAAAKKKDAPTAGAKATAPAPAAPPTPDIAAEAASANAKLGGWVYEIPEYKYEVIFRPMEGLLKKPEDKNDLLKQVKSKKK